MRVAIDAWTLIILYLTDVSQALIVSVVFCTADASLQ